MITRDIHLGNNQMLVYHGTTPQLAREFSTKGIDAHILYKRRIHGPQDSYPGIYVTPEISVARRFGLCVIAIEVEEQLLTLPPNLAILGATLDQSLNQHFEPQAFISTRIDPSQITLIECRENRYLLNPYATSIKDITSSASEILNTEETSIEARLLLQHVLKVNRAWLIAHSNDTLTSEQYVAFEAFLQRRINGEPIAHILGAREFFGLPLKVTTDTLIPRPDTETLVEQALAIIPQQSSYQVLDLGTGTGAIALAIAKNRPLAHVTAVDFSESALAVACENAGNLAIHNVTFLHSHWFSALNNQLFDVIVSNPPYIAENDPHLSLGDVRFEPKSALTSGADGLDDIRHIIKQAPQHLNPNGWLSLEHGYDQAKAVAELLAQAHFKEIGHGLDLAGIQRVTFGKV
jgi:release factor glutamine methyltransferase